MHNETIEIKGYEPELNINRLMGLNRIRYGKSSGATKFAYDCVMIIRAHLNLRGIKFTNPESIEVHLKVFRPMPNVDAQNFTKAFWDIVEQAIGINDKYFKTSAEAIDPAGPDDKEFYPHFEITIRGE